MSKLLLLLLALVAISSYESRLSFLEPRPVNHDDEDDESRINIKDNMKILKRLDFQDKLENIKNSYFFNKKFYLLELNEITEYDTELNVLRSAPLDTPNNTLFFEGKLVYLLNSFLKVIDLTTFKTSTYPGFDVLYSDLFAFEDGKFIVGRDKETRKHVVADVNNGKIIKTLDFIDSYFLLYLNGKAYLNDYNKDLNKKDIVELDLETGDVRNLDLGYFNEAHGIEGTSKLLITDAKGFYGSSSILYDLETKEQTKLSIRSAKFSHFIGTKFYSEFQQPRFGVTIDTYIVDPLKNEEVFQFTTEDISGNISGIFKHYFTQDLKSGTYLTVSNFEATVWKYK
jgi:hypothetical protein